VAVSSLFTACVDTVVTFVPDALSGYSDFRIGGFSSVTLGKLGPAAAVILAALVLALSLAGQMDVLALGEETARGLGLSVKWVRLGLLTIAAALAGAAVSFSGLLGFVGLIVPHMIRRMAGDSGAMVIGLSALGGAAFVTVCDLAARTLFAPYELPVGIVLAFVGAPFFLWLLRGQKRGHSHG
jgi:iron complex transport system permease protein